MSFLEKKLKKLRVKELKILLENNNISCAGNKTVLFNRAMCLLYSPKKVKSIAQEVDELYKLSFIPIRTKKKKNDEREELTPQLQTFLLFNEIQKIVKSQNLVLENGPMIVEFVLPSAMVKKIIEGNNPECRDGQLEMMFEVQLKFEETFGINEWEDLYINVEVNGTPLDVIHPSPHVIYITKFCSLEIGIVNKVILSSPRPNSTMGYDFDVSLVERIKPVDFVKKYPVKVQNNISSLVSNSIKGNVHRTYDVLLLCPKTKDVMKLPCRGDNCEHLEVFDLLTFLEDMQHYLKWKCPICAKMLTYDMLHMDELLKLYVNAGEYHLKFYSRRRDDDFNDDSNEDVVYETEVVTVND